MRSRPPEERLPAAIGAALLAALALRLVLSSPLTGYDEFAYARIAADLAEGRFSFSDASGYYGFRYLLVFPAAFFHAALGYGPAAAAAWPLLCSLGNTILAYLLVKELFGPEEGVAAAFLQAFLPASVIYGTMLYPEEVLVFWTGLSALLFLKGCSAPSLRPGAVLFSLSGLCAGLGWHTRLNSAVMLLVFAFWAWRTGCRPRWLFFAAGFLAAMLPDWLAGWALAGDPFHSLRAQLEKLAADTAVYPEGHFIYLRALLGADLYGLALFGFLFYSAAAGAALAWRRGDGRRLWLPLSWFLIVLVYLEFGPASLAPYRPVHKQLRFLSMALFPMVAVSAYLVCRLRPLASRGALALLLCTSAAAAWKLRDYNLTAAAPYGAAASYVAAARPSAVYADGGWGNALGYYTRPLHGEPYYRPKGSPPGFIRPFSGALAPRALSGACAVEEPASGRRLPPARPPLLKEPLELPGPAAVYCFR